MATRSWRDRVKFTTATTGTGTITQGSAVSGFQLFAAADDGKEFTFFIEDGVAWEVSKGTYTHVGTTLTRTLLSSSTGSLLVLNAGATVGVDWTAEAAMASTLAMQAVTPGGRLTLESGVPVSTTDQTAKTNVYYTPYIYNIINLWDGASWAPIEFAETTEALGTLTSGLPYDVFGFLSSGVLDLEKLAWTNGTTRATAITLQDGRYCKSGDKTRLYLGTFYTTATTTTEDSLLKRYLFNAYNRVLKIAYVSGNGPGHTYATAVWRYWNNSSANKVEFVLGVSVDMVEVSFNVRVNGNTTGYFLGYGVDTTAGNSGPNLYQTVGATSSQATSCFGSHRLGVGYHYVSVLEYTTTGTCTYDDALLTCTLRS